MPAPQHILLVLDDHDGRARELADLVGSGFPQWRLLAAAGDAGAAARVAGEVPTAVIVTDAAPGVEGMALAARLARLPVGPAPLYVLLASAEHHSFGVRLEALAAGLEGVLSLPYDRREIRTHLAAAAARLAMAPEPGPAAPLAERFHGLFADCEEATALVSATGALLALSPAAAWLLEQSDPRTSADPVRDLLPAAARAQLAAAHRGREGSGEAVATKLSVTLRRGTVGIQATAFPVPAGGTCYWVLHLARPVEDSCLISALAAAMQLRRASGPLPCRVHAVLVSDRKGMIRKASPPIEDLLGLHAETLVDCPISAVLPSLTNHTIESALATCSVDPNDGLPQEMLARAGNGRLVPVSVILSRVELLSDCLLVAIIEDVWSLRSQGRIHEQLFAAVQNTAEAVVITDTRPVILYANPAAERDTGYTLQEIQGRNPRLFASGQHDDEFYQRMWTRLARGETWSGHVVNRCRDGSLIDVQQVITPTRAEGGRIVHYVSVWRDVTSELQVIESLRRAQRMEGLARLAGGLVHDFNNVLTVISLSAQLVRTAVATDDHELATREIDEITTAVDRAARLSRRLLAFGRREDTYAEAIDLRQVVQDMATLLRRSLGPASVLAVSVSDAPCVVNADPGQIEQVLLNLVLNARDALPAGGNVTVRCEPVRLPAGRSGETRLLTCLAVADTGCGMTEQVRRRLFEPFFTTKAKDKGTGLGLSMVKRIIEAHGGHVEVRSTLAVVPAALERDSGSMARSLRERLPAVPVLVVTDDDVAVADDPATAPLPADVHVIAKPLHVAALAEAVRAALAQRR